MSTSQEVKTNAFDRYQEAASRTANLDDSAIVKRLQDNPVLIGLMNGALGATGEAGEIADHIKKVVYHGHELDIDYVVKECGDVLWYISDILNRLDVKLSRSAGVNIAKLKARYPEGFDEQKSINRDV